MNGDRAALERHRRLIAIKLRALVRDHLADESVGEPSAFAPGAALVHGAAAWVLLDERPGARLGAAIAWARRAGVGALHVIADAETGVLARRAAEFTLPISVWHADGRVLVPATAEPLRRPAAASPDHESFRSSIVEAGADPLVEHGVLSGEVRGLEVCRVVDDTSTASTRLEVGVGAHDREAFQLLHGDVPPAEALARIVTAVREHRRVGAAPHPLNRLAAERFLRWRVEQDPSLVGATELDPVPPPVPRDNLRDPAPCVAAGPGGAGPTIAVFATGVDLDLVPFAADARLAVEAAEPGVAGGGRLVAVVPSRDRLSVIEELAGLLRRPVELLGID